MKTATTVESIVPQLVEAETSGLLVIAQDGRSFQVLEKGKDSTKIYSALLTEAKPA